MVSAIASPTPSLDSKYPDESRVSNDNDRPLENEYRLIERDRLINLDRICGGAEQTLRKRFSVEQIINHLRVADALLAQDRTVGEVCRLIGSSKQSYYRWRREYGGLKVEQAHHTSGMTPARAPYSGISGPDGNLPSNSRTRRSAMNRPVFPRKTSTSETASTSISA